MKKFISAVTSIAMAATMAASAMPFSASAVEESKTLSLRTVDVAGLTFASSNTVEVDATTEAQTITCGLYLEESVELEVQTIKALFGVKLAEGQKDPGITLSSLTAEDGTEMTSITQNYFAANTEMTSPSGIAIKSKKLPIFTGTISSTGSFAPNVPVPAYYDIQDSRAGSGTGAPELSSITYSWLSEKGSIWTGATSDEFPCLYFNVNIPAALSIRLLQSIIL